MTDGKSDLHRNVRFVNYEKLFLGITLQQLFRSKNNSTFSIENGYCDILRGKRQSNRESMCQSIPGVRFSGKQADNVRAINE